MTAIVQLIIFTLCFLTSFIEANKQNFSLKMDHNLQLYKNYVDMDKQLKYFMDRNIKMMLPYILEANENINVSTTCMNNLFQFMTGLRKLTEWSVSFLDSIGKPQSGMLSGNVHMLGESYQCFNAVAKKNGKISFRGQYCSVKIQAVLPDVNYKFDGLNNLTQHSSGALKLIFSNLRTFSVLFSNLGLCVPSGCTKEDISEMFNYLTRKVPYINTTVEFCLKEEDMSYWSKEKIIVVCVFAFLGMLLITSTIFDIRAEKSKNKKIGLPSKILQCFSLAQNFPKLIKTNTSEKEITSFCGIRVLSVFWIVLSHEIFIHANGVLANHLRNADPFIMSFFAQIILNGFSAVNVFFLLGGFVNCYTRINIQKSGNSQLGNLKIIIHRLWRIYPTCIVAFLIHILLSSPNPSFYGISRKIQEPCTKHWWKIFLFINNFFMPSNVCLSHTWYISADMQIFLLSLITIPILLWNEKLGLYLHIGVIIIANFCSFSMWWILNLSPTPGSVSNIRDVEYNTYVYVLPLTHIAPYYIGILLGYVTATKKKKHFSKIVYFIGWLTASLCFTTVLFLTYRWNSGTPHSKLESSLYGSFSTTINALSISWMVYCCQSGQARLINYILSLKIWIPLSRLTYMLYLISVLVQVYYKSNLYFPSDFTHVVLIWSYFGNLFISILMSLALVLIAESPLLALEKIVFRNIQYPNKSSFEVKKEDTDEDKKETVFIENLNNKNSV